ncbi:muts domain V-domain-containing protein [Gaertneriomyces semiglobifer]|nr:muts domain V-domain-containing protein [Gaertneriomyces semiglobifer]
MDLRQKAQWASVAWALTGTGAPRKLPGCFRLMASTAGTKSPKRKTILASRTMIVNLPRLGHPRVVADVIQRAETDSVVVKEAPTVTEPNDGDDLPPDVFSRATGGETPLMKEIDALHEPHSDKVLLVQVGDFYEIYDYPYLEDVTAILTLRIALNSNGRRWAGFPLGQLRERMGILLRNGYSVAIAEEVGKDLHNKTKQKIRKVVRVITPATVLDEISFDRRENRFLLCVTSIPTDSSCNDLGLAWCDITTGDFAVCETTMEEFEHHFSRIQPTEVLLDSRIASAHPELVKFVREVRRCPISVRNSSQSAGEYMRTWLTQECPPNNTRSRKTALSTYTPRQIQAAGTLLAYIADSMPCNKLTHTAPVEFIREEVMQIDAVTVAALEVTKTFREGKRKGSLLDAIDRTKTKMGSRLLAERLKAPSVCRSEINRRLDLVDLFFHDSHLRAEVVHVLSKIKDAEYALQCIMLGTSTPERYSTVVQFLQATQRVHEFLKLYAENHTTSDGVQVLLSALSSLLDLGSIRAGVSAVLDDARRSRDDLLQSSAAFRANLATAYDIPTIRAEIVTFYDPKVGPIVDVKSLKAAERRALIDSLKTNPKVQIHERKGSIVRFSHGEWTVLHSIIMEKTREVEAIQREVFEGACAIMKDNAVALRRLLKAIAEVDVSSANATLAQDEGYVRPDITDEPVHDIKAGRHPVVEVSQRRREEMYFENDAYIGGDCRLWVFTGPNMGGKSTFLRKCALMSILAQTGLFVPATSARLGIVDKAFARVGASDDLALNQSTFMVEMMEMANILKNATDKSIVIVDEIGRGLQQWMAWHWRMEFSHTCTMSIAAAKNTSNQNLGLENVECFKTDVLQFEEGLIYTYKVKRGVAAESFGIHCARKAGVPEDVVQKAVQYRTKYTKELRIKDDLYHAWRRSENSARLAYRANGEAFVV